MDWELFFFYEDGGQTAIGESYQNADGRPLLQDDTAQFLDNGETNAAIFEGSYQQSDNTPAASTVPAEVDFDWSEPLSDYQFNHFTNVDQPSLTAVEEPWQDADVEHETDWWVSDPQNTTPVVVVRQNGDDDAYWLIEDVGEDISSSIISESLGADYIPPASVVMPDLIGLLFAEASEIVEALGLVMTTPPQQQDIIYPLKPEPAMTVIQQYPLPGANVAIGSTVWVIVSSGLTYYPNMSGARIANAPNQFAADDTPP